jgi:hypothetical protein
MKQDPYTLLDRLVGSWVTEAAHPAMPGVVVHGSVDIEWLEGKRFLIHRARTDHPDFPDSVSLIGNTEHDIGDDAPGTSQVRENNAPWRDDLAITYRRRT